MKKYIIKRILISIVVLFGITFINYALMDRAGDPMAILVGPKFQKGAIEARRVSLGYDKPFIVQYFVWLREVLGGNLGYSIRSYKAVDDLIFSHIGNTLMIMLPAMILSLIISVPLGIYAAVNAYKKRDRLIVGLSYIATGVPGFFLSLVLIYIFSIKLKVLPASGMETLSVGGGVGDLIAHMIMPVIVLTVFETGFSLRYVRGAMIEVLEKDYIKMARAKGVGILRVIFRHGLRNVLLTIITIIGMQIPAMFGGSVVVEQIFSWPGIGLMTMSAISGRDYPVIMGVSLFAAVVVLIVNIIVDILYNLADPAVKTFGENYEEK